MFDVLKQMGQWCSPQALELGALSSIAEVGIGLFLALAVVQVVGAGDIAKLRRKASRLQEVVVSMRLDSHRGSVANVNAELLRLELSLEKLSNWFFRTTFIAICLGTLGMAIITFLPDAPVKCHIVWALTVFYLILPFVSFLLASLVIRRKSTSVRRLLNECEDRVLTRS